MANFAEQPTSSNRERFDNNEESRKNTKEQLAKAVASENYVDVAELEKQMESLQEEAREFKKQAEEDACGIENIRKQFSETAVLGDADKIIGLGQQLKVLQEQESENKNSEYVEDMKKSRRHNVIMKLEGFNSALEKVIGGWFKELFKK